MDLFGMGPMELLLILVIALIIFGPSRLPEMGSTLGKAIRELRKTASQFTEAVLEEGREKEGGEDLGKEGGNPSGKQEAKPSDSP